MTTAESSPLLAGFNGMNGGIVPNNNSSNNEEHDTDVMDSKHPEAPSPSSFLSSSSLLLTTSTRSAASSRRQSLSSSFLSLLPVINEDASGSNSSSNSNNSSNTNSPIQNKVCHSNDTNDDDDEDDDDILASPSCIVWPPQGYVTWPPSSNDGGDGLSTMTSIAHHSCRSVSSGSSSSSSSSSNLDLRHNYGSLLTHSVQHHPLIEGGGGRGEEQKAQPSHRLSSTTASSPLSSTSSSPFRNLNEYYNYYYQNNESQSFNYYSNTMITGINRQYFATRTKTSTSANTRRSFLIATLTFTFMAVTLWLPVITQRPESTMTTTTTTTTTHSSSTRSSSSLSSIKKKTNKKVRTMNYDDTKRYGTLTSRGHRDVDDDDDMDEIDDPRREDTKDWAQLPPTPRKKSTSTTSIRFPLSLPFYRRSYEDTPDRDIAGNFDEDDESIIQDGDNHDQNDMIVTQINNITNIEEGVIDIVDDVDPSLFGQEEEEKEDQGDQINDSILNVTNDSITTPTGILIPTTTPVTSNSLSNSFSFTPSSEITFSDLARKMLPLYFQKTVQLCISTIQPSSTTTSATIIHSHVLSDEDDGMNNSSHRSNATNTVTKTIKTTSVLPGDVFKLRKTMLKTRDMMDVFSPVYPSTYNYYHGDVMDDHRRHRNHRDNNEKKNLSEDREGVMMTLEPNHDYYRSNRLGRANEMLGMKMIKMTKKAVMPHQEHHHRPSKPPQDVWYTLRKFLDGGYTLIGDFQDLDHAKIKVSPSQLAKYQLQVWEWHTKFLSYVTKNRHYIRSYLSMPCQESQQEKKKVTKKEKMDLQHQKHCQYVHSHSSHLFWGSIQSQEELPNGLVDKASDVLGRLGYMQLDRASMYLVDVMTREFVIPPSSNTTNEYEMQNTTSSSDDGATEEIDNGGDNNEDEESDKENDVHEIYHNLRKELRSFLDELDLFGSLLLPHSSIIPEIVLEGETAAVDAVTIAPSDMSSTSHIAQEQTDSAVDILRSVRNMLGDLNDSYVAYAKYLEWNEYIEERSRLQQVVEKQWIEFKDWANEVDLIAKLNFLKSEIDPTAHAQEGNPEADSVMNLPASLDSFLAEQKTSPSHHFIVGNDAGDADSIISAITLAYIETFSSDGETRTPVVSISKDMFDHARPDINLLLELGGIQNASDKLLFINDLNNIVAGTDVNSNGIPWLISLVDHNTLNDSLNNNVQTKLIVQEIVDHHVDEGQYQATCTGKYRNIAFHDSLPLVASTCTLVAERLREQREFFLPYSPSLGILLLGVILLDSVNLDETIGKVTERDKAAVNDLVINTDWSEVGPALRFLQSDENGRIYVNTTMLFDDLQMAKYDPRFWSDISVDRALVYDLKDFRQDDKDNKFGISTILMSATDFMEKDNFLQSTNTFMEAEGFTFFCIMFVFYDDQKKFHRQLAFISNKSNLRTILDSLLISSMYTMLNLQLEELAIPSEFVNSSPEILVFNQNNVVPSRKEIGPMMEDFFTFQSLESSNSNP